MRKMLSEIHSMGSRKIIKSISNFRILVWDFFRSESNHQEPTGNRHRPTYSTDKNLKTFYNFFRYQIFRDPCTHLSLGARYFPTSKGHNFLMNKYFLGRSKNKWPGIDVVEKIGQTRCAKVFPKKCNLVLISKLHLQKPSMSFANPPT